jgi:hypothetical protein
MTKRMMLLLLLILPVGLGGCYWHDRAREEYRPRQGNYYGPGDYRQGRNASEYPEYHRQEANMPGGQHEDRR